MVGPRGLERLAMVAVSRVIEVGDLIWALALVVLRVHLDRLQLLFSISFRNLSRKLKTEWLRLPFSEAKVESRQCPVCGNTRSDS